MRTTRMGADRQEQAGAGARPSARRRAVNRGADAGAQDAIPRPGEDGAAMRDARLRERRRRVLWRARRPLHPLSRLKIAHKLTLGFGLVLACIVVLGVLAITLARAQGTATLTLIQDVHPIAAAAHDLLLQQVNEETGARAFVATGQDVYLAPYTDARARVGVDIAVLTAHDAGRPALRQTIEGRVEPEVRELDVYFARLIAQVRSGQRAAALGQFRAGKQDFDAFRTAMARVFQQTDDLVAAAQEDSAAHLRAMIQIVLAATIAAILFALAIGLLIARSLTRPLQQLRDVTVRLVAGDTTAVTDLPVPAIDEVGALSASFHALVARQQHLTEIAAAAARGDLSLLRDLAASAEQLHTVYAAMAGGVVVVNAVGAIVDANAAAEEVLGVPLDEMRGHVLADSLWPVTRLDGAPVPRDERPAVVALRTGQPQRDATVWLTRPDGTQRAIQIDAVPLLGNDGAAAQVVVSYLDLTARLRAEETARASAERFRALIEQATDLVSVVAPDGTVRYSSPSHVRLLGTDPVAEEGERAGSVRTQNTRP